MTELPEPTEPLGLDAQGGVELATVVFHCPGPPFATMSVSPFGGLKELARDFPALQRPSGARQPSFRSTRAKTEWPELDRAAAQRPHDRVARCPPARPLHVQRPASDRRRRARSRG